MKSMLTTLMLILTSGAMLFAADAGNPSTQPSTQPTTQPINQFCAIEQDHPVDPNAKTVEYKGMVIGFCCEDCIEKFSKEPEKYLKDLK